MKLTNGVIAVLAMAIGASVLPSIAAQKPKEPRLCFDLNEAIVAAAEFISNNLPDKKQVYVTQPIAQESINQDVKLKLLKKLKDYGIEATPTAKVKATLLVFPLDSGASGLPLGMRLSITIFLPNGKQVPETLDILNPVEAIVVVGETGETLPRPPNNPNDALIPPKVQPSIVGGTRAFPAAGSPYSLEILVKDANGQYKPRTISATKGILKVDLQPKDSVAVKVYNGSNYDAAVQLTTDGLSRFTFSEDIALQDAKDLVTAGANRLLTGYYRNAKEVFLYRIDEYPTKVLDRPETGNIAVVFHATWEKGKTPPPGEMDLNLEMAKKRAINPGDVEIDRTKLTQRELGSPRAVIRVRYDLGSKTK